MGVFDCHKTFIYSNLNDTFYSKYQVCSDSKLTKFDVHSVNADTPDEFTMVFIYYIYIFYHIFK